MLQFSSYPENNGIPARVPCLRTRKHASVHHYSYISTQLFPRALPWLATFSDTGTFVCPSARLRLSFVFGGDFFLSRDVALGIACSLYRSI